MKETGSSKSQDRPSYKRNKGHRGAGSCARRDKEIECSDRGRGEDYSTTPTSYPHFRPATTSGFRRRMHRKRNRRQCNDPTEIQKGRRIVKFPTKEETRTAETRKADREKEEHIEIQKTERLLISQRSSRSTKEEARTAETRKTDREREEREIQHKQDSPKRQQYLWKTIQTPSRFSIRQDDQSPTSTNDCAPSSLPFRPETLELHNLCEDPSAVPQELIDIIGLDLGYGVALPLKEENPIDFDRLRRSIRIQCEKFQNQKKSTTLSYTNDPITNQKQPQKQ